MFQRLTLILLIIISVSEVVAQYKEIVTNNTDTANYFFIKENSDKLLHIKTSFKNIKINNTTTPKGDFCELNIDHSYSLGKKGEPQLPAFRKIVQIPSGAKVKAELSCTDTAFFNLNALGFNKIAPRQPSQSKSAKKQRYIRKRRAYRRNYFSQHNIIDIKKIGTLRDIDLCQISINPIFYNSKQNTLQVLNNIDLQLHFDTIASKTGNSKTTSPFFEPIYSTITNYKGSTNLTSQYTTKYLIVTDEEFRDALTDLIIWKNQKGFEVIVVTTQEIGKTATDIKTWITAQYNTNTKPTFLLLAADTDKIPCSQVGEDSGYGTDLYYACMDGNNDIIPDIFYGRLSASTAQEMKDIVDKIVEYEKFQFPDPSYLSHATLIAGYDATYRPAVGIPSLNYITKYHVNENNNFSTINKFTKTYTSCYADSVVASSLLTYTAHGTTTTWVDPYLSKDNVRSIDNSHKYPFIVANCCLSGNITTKECIGETWLRKANGGAIAYIGCSPKSYWHEDFYWSVGAHNFRSGISPDSSQTTTGAFDAAFTSNYICGDALIFVGNLAVSEAIDSLYYHTVTSRYYWEGYNYLGDPSLLPFLGMPKENTVTHDTHHPLSVSTINIKAQSGSLVALSHNGKLVTSGFVANNASSIDLDIHNITESCTLDVVVTKPHHKPYFSTIELISPNLPYITINESTLTTQKVEYASTITPSFNIINVGLMPNQTTTYEITTNSPYVTKLINNHATIAQLNHNQTATLTNACQITIAANTPDQTEIDLFIKFIDPTNQYTTKHTFVVNSPLLQISPTIDIATPNNCLMPNDTADLNVCVTNVGHASLKNGSVKIIPNPTIQYASFITNECTLNNLHENTSSTCTFKITADISAETMSDYDFSIIATDQQAPLLSDTVYHNIKIGKWSKKNIGNGSSSQYKYPFNNYYECGKTQILYSTNDLGQKPISITEMALDFDYVSSHRDFKGFTNFKIMMKATSLNAITDTFSLFDSTNIVFSRDTLRLLEQKGFQPFTLDKQFKYYGDSNLIVDITWGDNEYYIGEAYRTKVNCHTTSFNSVGYDCIDDWEELTFYNSTNIRPNTQFSYEKPRYVLFTVTDSVTNQPISNAVVNIDGDTFTTDSLGKVCAITFRNTYNRPYSVLAFGYNVHSNMLKTIGDTLFVNTQMHPHIWDLKVQIVDNDSKQPISDASVTIGDTTLQTDNNGCVLLHNIRKPMPITVNKEHYTTDNFSFKLKDEQTPIIEIVRNLKRKRYKLDFIVTADTTPLSNIKITIHSISTNTNNCGMASYSGLYHTPSLPYQLNLGYATICDTINLLCDTTININTTAIANKYLFDIEFVVTDTNNIPIDSALITFGNTTLLTNEFGKALFPLIKNGSTLNYTIIHNSYITSTDTIFCNQNKTVQIRLNTSATQPTGYLEHNSLPIKIYPNPTNGTINIDSSEKFDISIFDLNNNLIKKYKYHGQAINLKPIVPGIYIIKFENKTKTISKYVIVK